MKFKRGLSDPSFCTGGQSEFDRAIDIAARAMYVISSTNHDPGRDWDEMLNFPPQATTVSHYRKLAAAALGAVNNMRDEE